MIKYVFNPLSGTFDAVNVDSASISGTTGVLPKFTSANTIGDSSIEETTLQINIGKDVVVTGVITATGGSSTDWNTAFSWGNHASAGYATQNYVNTAVANLVDSAPGTLDTLNELAAALGDDPSFATTVSTALGNRLRIDVSNQGLTAQQKTNGQTNLGVLIGTDVQAYDADLSAIAALAGTSGLLRKTASNTWSLDTNTYLTSYAETDTLNTVTGRGSTTTNSITVGGLTVDTDTLHVDSANNRVGIRTTSPRYDLEVNGTAYIKNLTAVMAGEGFNDTGMIGILYDRNELTNASYRGGITINISGAGTFSNTQAAKNMLVNAVADYFTIDGLTNASVVTMVVDTGVNVLNYGSGYWQPFFQTRTVYSPTATFPESVVVEVSVDGTTWYAPATGWSISNFTTNNLNGLWMATRGTPGTPGATWRYARFTLSNFVVGSQYGLWISQIGVRHTAAPVARQFANTLGDTFYGNLTVSGTNKLGVGTLAPVYKVDVQGTTIADSSIRTQGAFDINPLSAPVAISGYTLSAGTNLGVGQYYYFVTYVTAVGETSAGSTLSVVTTTGNTTVNLTGIPVSSDPRVTSRKIYRTKIGGTTDNQWFLATINDNTTTTYTDSIPDASLTGVGLQAYKVNTTARYFTVAGVQGMVIDPNLTAFGRNAGANIINTNAPSVRTVLIGATAGQNITTGAANVVVGYAGGAITTGGSNTIVGDLAAYLLTSGSNNVILGAQSGRFLVTTNSNVIVGAFAARYLADGTTQFTSGVNNTILGNDIRMFSSTDTNSIVIGNSAQGLGSNTTVLGNGSISFTSIPSGNVGIGTTSNAGYKLDVNGTIRLAETLTIEPDAGGYSTHSRIVLKSGNNLRGAGVFTSGADATWFVGNPFTDFSNSFIIGRSNVANPYDDAAYLATAILTVKSDGSVGIGTTSPATRLEVVGPSYIQHQIRSTNSAAGLKFVPSTGSNYELQATNNNEFIIYNRTVGAYSLMIKDNGNILINTITDSGYKIDVNGTARIQGAITATLTNTQTASIVNYNTLTGVFTYSDNFTIYGLGVTTMPAASGDDLNNTTATGFYRSHTATLNAPVSSFGVGINLQHNATNAVQLFTDRGSVTPLYIRKEANSVWSTWKRIWDENAFTQTTIDTWNDAYARWSGNLYTDFNLIDSNQFFRGHTSTVNYPPSSDQSFISGISTLYTAGNGFMIASSRSAARPLSYRKVSNGAWSTWYDIHSTKDFSLTDVANWNTAYNDKINSAAVTGTSTKTLTLTQQDAGTVVATWTDKDTTYSLAAEELPTGNTVEILLAASDSNNSLVSLIGAGSITLTADQSGNVTIDGVNTTYTAGTGLTLTGTQFSLAAHTHAITDVTGLQSALDAKAPLASPTFTGVPAAPTAVASTNSTQIATTQFVQTVVSNLVNSAPAALDTLNELATALGNDPNFATTTSTALGNRLRVDVSTQGLTGTQQSNGRINLGSTTVGSNLFTLTNPSAVTFLRVNADNTVSALDAASFRTAIGAGTSSATGTVTSVALTVPTGLSITGSPITTSGTLAISLQAGYSIPTTSSQTNWNTAYGWGNHATAGYLQTNGGLMTGAIDMSNTQIKFSSNTPGFPLFGTNTPPGTRIVLDAQVSQASVDFAIGTNTDSTWFSVPRSLDTYYFKWFGGQTEIASLNGIGEMTAAKFIETSSLRYKDNVTSLDTVSNKVDKLRPVTYNRKGLEDTEIGLIAEEVAELFPEVVMYDEQQRPDGINYSRLSAVLIKAVQELSAEVKKLKSNA